MATNLPNPVTFQELIDAGLLEIGDGYRAKNSELGEGGPIFLRAGHVTDSTIDFEGVEHFKADLYEKVQGKLAKPGDTIVTTKGNSTGRTSYVREEMPRFVYSPHLSYWRSLDHEQLVPQFLRYWSRATEFVDQLRGMMVSTDMAPYLSLTDQRRLTITLPSPRQQLFAGDTLGAFDDKIELNRRMNELLEGIARALFKAWFIDFQPVRAKTAGAASFPGMPQPIFNQLPDRFVDSEIGDAPDGWAVEALDTLFDINPSRPLRKGETAPYLEMADMPTRGHAPDRWVHRPFGSGTRFKNGDTLVARITPCLENGKTAFVDFLPDDTIGWGSTEYIVLRPRPPFPEFYAYCLARSTGFRDFAISNMTGTSGRQRVPATVFSHFPAVKPDRQILECFGNRVSPLFATIAANINENRVLTQIRDALLPRLISGEISVPVGHGGGNGE